MTKFKKLVILCIAAFLVLSFTVGAAVIYIVQNNHEFVLEHELMRGLEELLEDPDRLLTRGEFIRLVAALEQADLSTSWSSWLWDVFDDTPHSEAIRWANYHWIVQGFGDLDFMPYWYVTKEQAAVMLSRYIQIFNITITNEVTNYYGYAAFEDFDEIGYWAIDDVLFLLNRGIIERDESGFFNARGGVSAEYAAGMLARFIQNSERREGENISKPGDVFVPDNSWQDDWSWEDEWCGDDYVNYHSEPISHWRNFWEKYDDSNAWFRDHISFWRNNLGVLWTYEELIENVYELSPYYFVQLYIRYTTGNIYFICEDAAEKLCSGFNLWHN